jgi:hypothetical protein
VKDSYRVRVNTAVLLVGLILLPLSAGWVHPSYYPAKPELLHKAVGWLYDAASPQILFIAFLLSLGYAAYYSRHLLKRGAFQCTMEAIVSILAFILIPAY